MKIVVDTNVILDFFLARDPYVISARQLFEMIYTDKLDGYVTANSITDIYYILAKRLGDGTARDAVKKLLMILTIITVSGDDCNNALNLPIPDFEDALVTVCASKEDINYIVSNDKEFLQANQQLTNIVSSKELLELI